MDSRYSLAFLLKCYERLECVMSVCHRAAAARRRRGVLARAAYAMRKERYADAPRLPLARAGSIGSVLTLSPAPSDVSQGARALSSDSEPRRKKRKRRRRVRPARGALPPRHVLDAAELGAALDFYDDFTKAVSSRCVWRSSVSPGDSATASRWRGLPRAASS